MEHEPTPVAVPTSRWRRWSRRRRLLVIGAAVAIPIVVFVLVYFEPQAAFIDEHVDEPLAGLDLAADAADAPAGIADALGRAAASGRPVVVSSGEFVSGEHGTRGTALVVALPTGGVVVRFEDLDTSNGPDLRVIVSPDEASGAHDYSGRVELGSLKGNIGDQNYAVAVDVDLTRFRSVVVWCERFDVAFGAASIDVAA